MAKNTIILKGDPIRKEGVAGGTILPGSTLIWSSDTLIENNTAADADAPRMFAVENDLIGDDIDTAYATDDQVQYIVPRTGDEIYAWLIASGDVAKGAPLECGAAGDLQAYSSGRIQAFAAEAVDNSGGGTHARIQVEAA